MTDEAVQKADTATSVWARLAERNGMDPRAFEMSLRETILPDKYAKASSATIAAFLIVADQYKLNPFTKEIFAFETRGGGIMPIVSIDGWYKIANSHPKFDGWEHEDERDEGGHVVSTTVKMHRKDRAHPTVVTEYMSECARNSEPWKKWPARMLRHKAFIQAARAAFGFAGIYDPDEGERIQEADVIAVKGPDETEKGAAGLLDRISGDEGVVINVDEETGEVEVESTPPKDHLFDTEDGQGYIEREPGEEG
jgi:phage recombination protein Bet